jgi:hypothetical protein
MFSVRKKRIHHRDTEEDEGAQRGKIFFNFCESKKRTLLPLCPLIPLCASVVNPPPSPKKHSFFLLEIVIAIVLVGMFAAGFLGSGLRYLSQERKALVELEFEREKDLVRMEAIAACWKEGEIIEPRVFEKTLQTKIGGKEYKSSFRVKVRSKKIDDHCDLILEEGTRKYHFLVN